MRLTTPFFVLALAACNDTHVPEPGIAECDFQEHAVGWDEPSPPHDQAAEDLLAFAEGTHDAIGGATYHDGEVEIEMELERRGEHAYHLESTVCGDRHELPVTLTFWTSDGFDEVLEVRGEVQGDALRIRTDLDPEALGGTYEPPPPEEGTVRGMVLEVTFLDDGTTTGVVLLQTEGQEGDGDDGVAWADESPLLGW